LLNLNKNQTTTFSIGLKETTLTSSNTSTSRKEDKSITQGKAPQTFTASLKLDHQKAGLQASQFMDEVMSHLQALPDHKIEMTIEVRVDVPKGIDEQTARIILENSNSLKVDNPQIY